ncbi:MAG: hypothetical protein QOC95_1172 [Thermoleophilaceae bacterium]|jgi:hypothetical protein|nr:hypothetical protein [Thermoleophilaceae bacterium]
MLGVLLGRTKVGGGDGGASDVAPMPAAALHASRRQIGICAAALAAVAALVWGPHVLHGGFYWDDWENAATTRYQYQPDFLGPIDLRQAAYRPVLQLLLPLAHALFGTRPALHIALAVVLAAAASLVLFSLLRALTVPAPAAATAAVLMLIFPWSDSTRLWPTAGLNNVALCLYLGGVTVALRAFAAAGVDGARSRRARRLAGLSVAMYVLSILTYDATALVALASLPIYRVRVPWRVALRRWRLDVAAVGVTVVAAELASTKRSHGLEFAIGHARTIGDEALSLLAKVLFPFGSPPRALVLGAFAALLVVAALVARRLPAGSARRADLRRWLGLTAASLVAIAITYAIFVPGDAKYVPLAPGVYNRVNLVAAPGFALLVCALAGTVAALVAGRARTAGPRTALAIALVVPVAVSWTARAVDDQQVWRRSAADQERVLSVLSERLPHPPRGAVVYTFGAPASTAPGVPVFGQSWDLFAAAKVRLNDPTVRAFPVSTGEGVSCTAAGVRVLAPGQPLYPTTSYRAPTYFLDVPAGEIVRVTGTRACRSYSSAMFEVPKLTIRDLDIYTAAK